MIQTKTHATNIPDARSHIERYCMELGVEYIDTVLLHCMTKEGWPAENQGAMDYLMQAKQEKLIRAMARVATAWIRSAQPPRIRSLRST